MQSSTSRLAERYSNSPLPCRSPSPDLMSRSSIINTRHITNVPTQLKKQQTAHLSSADELRFLRADNKRLVEILASSGKEGMNRSQSDLLREKDRVI